MTTFHSVLCVPCAKPQCPFGARCYQTNPKHFRAMSHPDGHIGGGATLAIAPPMCPFGKACYRKNPQHFLEESHPTIHTGATRAIKHTLGLRTGNETWDHRHKGPPLYHKECPNRNGSVCSNPNCAFQHEWQDCKFGDKCDKMMGYCCGKHPRDS